MLKDMFIFAVRNIKSYRKFFIHIVIILSLLLCLCSIYVCSVTAIYDSYDSIQNINLKYNYVEINDDIPIHLKDHPAQENEQWMKYGLEITKRTKYNPSVPQVGTNLYQQIDTSFTVIIDNKNYTSNVDKENIYFEGIDLDDSMFTKNEEIGFKSEFGSRKNIIIKGTVLNNNNEIVINEKLVEYFGLDIDNIIGKTISFKSSDYQSDEWKIVGVVSKNYTTDTIYISSTDGYFNKFNKYYQPVTRFFFDTYEEGEKAYSQLFKLYSGNIVTYAAEDMSSSISTLQSMITFMQIIFIIFIVILGSSFLVTLALKVDSIIHLQKTFLGVLISHGFERRKVDMLLWVQVIICGTFSSVVAAVLGTVFVFCSKPLFTGLGVNVVLNFGVFMLSLGVIFVLMLIILFAICAPMFIKLRKNDIIDYLR